MKINFLIFIFLILTLPLYSAEQGGTSSAFLNYCNSVRSYSLSRTGITNYNDPASFTGNPALLTGAVKSMYAMYSRPLSEFSGIQYQGIFYNNRPGNSQTSGFGLGLILLNVSDIEQRDNAGNLTGSYSGDNIVSFLSFGYEARRDVALGLTAKIIHRDISGHTANAYSLDAGSLVHLHKNITAALTVKNIFSLTSNYTFITESEDLPAVFNPEFTLRLFDKVSINAACSFYEGEQDFEYSTGLEFNYISALDFRTGYNSRFNELTAGFGLNMDKTKLDYAFGNNNDLGNTHRLGLTYYFK